MEFKVGDEVEVVNLDDYEPTVGVVHQMKIGQILKVRQVKEERERCYLSNDLWYKFKMLKNLTDNEDYEFLKLLKQ